MQTPELKPCPFCGGMAISKKALSAVGENYWLLCEDCGVETATYTSREDAANAWNRRANDADDKM